MKTLLCTVPLAVVASLLASSLPARPASTAAVQFPQASPAASFKEHIGLTGVSVEYSRPGVKGRKIFGGLVPYGEVWRTGANSATKISFSTDVNFAGTAVSPGDYALFTIPGANEWTVILNKVSGQWGSYAYDEKSDVARTKVKPVALPDLLETMTISLSDIHDDFAMLNIAWEKTRVSVKIETDTVNVVVEQIDAAMAKDGKKPYFESAMFYYEHNLDLKKAVGWMDAAIKEQPDQVWMIYRKGLILAKAGDKAGATAAAKQSLELAEKAGGAIGAEYKHLNEVLLASLK
jgi:Protein of unknown function (DUF2911)